MSTPSNVLAKPLSAEHVAQFHNEGYLVVNDVLDETVLSRVIDEITTEIDIRARALVAAGKLSIAFDELDFCHRLTAIAQETDEVHKSIIAGRLCGAGIFGLVSYFRLLDAMEQLCGPEIIASSVYRLRPKMPGHPLSKVPWHQDSGYFEPYCDQSLIVTVWLPLVDATPDNGCLWVLPRAHRHGIIRHRGDDGKVYLRIDESDLPAGNAVCVPVRKGSVLLMTNLTPHASFDNLTDGIRWSMDLRYQSSKIPTNAPIMRLEDEVRHGDRPEVPTACYPPEADFLVRSITRPDDVVCDPGTFAKIRTQHAYSPMTNRWSFKFFEG